jgi:hypothetical protein
LSLSRAHASKRSVSVAVLRYLEPGMHLKQFKRRQALEPPQRSTWSVLQGHVLRGQRLVTFMSTCTQEVRFLWRPSSAFEANFFSVQKATRGAPGPSFRGTALRGVKVSTCVHRRSGASPSTCCI